MNNGHLPELKDKLKQLDTIRDDIINSLAYDKLSESEKDDLASRLNFTLEYNSDSNTLNIISKNYDTTN